MRLTSPAEPGARRSSSAENATALVGSRSGNGKYDGRTTRASISNAATVSSTSTDVMRADRMITSVRTSGSYPNMRNDTA